MLVKSRVAWRGHARNTPLDVDPKDPDVKALLASGRLTRLEDPREHMDAIVGTPDGVPDDDKE